MFAIIRTGGKQYKVKTDDIIKVEKLESQKGEMVSLDSVLLISSDGKTQFGQPLIEGAVVRAEILDHAKNDKVIVFKKKRRQNYRRKKGHRQLQTVIRISGIYADGKVPAKEPVSSKTSKKAAPKVENKKKVTDKPKETKTVKKKVVKKESATVKKVAKSEPKKASSAKKAAAKKEK